MLKLLGNKTVQERIMSQKQGSENKSIIIAENALPEYSNLVRF